MRTSRAISSISYNTPSFLCSVLDNLILNRSISFYFFIYHFAEKDERKDHIHLYLEPNGQIDTNSLTDLFNELDLNNPSNPPLGVMPWRPSKFGDAYLYFIHHKDYLNSKMQSRSYSYSFEDVVCSNYDFLNELVHTIDYTKYFKFAEFSQRVQDGVDFVDMVKSGYIPVPQINAYSTAYSLIRNGRQSHTPINKNES